eukprot:CAMPEP_0206579252 /NCGR_PEP_ID=MMETSP0325_2-20121206/32446_1 /ASSEMBLY_ACC=CAM_ASM_000347 /TAXON_ID=2866 /ORGANISM="Crypthecodinium cohnii, Strain Seligo" /LENGTH=52 /DNA_ID=CAMNT_0054085043 /DNA_START=519 /DNA_END=674 /DNA_ORIENTATION=+
MLGMINLPRRRLLAVLLPCCEDDVLILCDSSSAASECPRDQDRFEAVGRRNV